MFKRIRERGLRIQWLNTFIVVTTLTMSVLIICSNTLLNQQYNDLMLAESIYNDSVENASMLQAGSDNLTKQVQHFAQTADLNYLEAYFEEVRSQRREAAVTGLDVTEEEQAIIDLAKWESDQLMNMEYHVMRLTMAASGADLSQAPAEVRDYPLREEELNLDASAMQARARELVFGAEYQQMKNSIDDNIRVFTEKILQREAETISVSLGKVSRHIALQQALIIITGLCVAAMGLLVYSQVIRVLRRHVDCILADEPLERRGVYELRYLSQVYNQLRMRNHFTEEMLEKKANYDALTGIPNRGAFETLVKQKTSRSGSSTNAFLLIDIDKFKNINDVYGHYTGDNILKKVAVLLSESFRDSDFISRLGGDEFGLWLADLSEEHVKYIHARIQRMNEKLGKPEDDLPATSVSGGIAFHTKGDSFQTLYQRADEALYRAKHSGGRHCES